MAAYTVCRNPKCATLVEGRVEVCPKCGERMKIVGESPWRGWVLIMCGLIMTIMMGVITFNLYPELTNPGVRSADGGSWTGGAESARMVLLLFYGLIAFGVVCLANGIYMLVTRQQTKTFMFVSLGLAAAVLLIAFLTMGTIKANEPEEQPRRVYGY